MQQPSFFRAEKTVKHEKHICENILSHMLPTALISIYGNLHSVF